MADFKVRSNPNQARVSFFLEGMTFGDPRLDKRFSVRLRVFLYESSGRLLGWMPFRRNNSPAVESFLDDVEDLQRMKSAGLPLDGIESHPDSLPVLTQTPIRDGSLVETTEYDISADGEDSVVRLNCAVQLRLNITLPPALAVIPRIIVGSVGRIVVRHILNAYLPNFLKLVVEDYHAWVTGAPRGSTFLNHCTIKTTQN